MYLQLCPPPLYVCPTPVPGSLALLLLEMLPLLVEWGSEENTPEAPGHLHKGERSQSETKRMLLQR